MSDLRRWLQAYYWATPAFWLADELFGANVRVVALEGSPEWKPVYYLFCAACGGALLLKGHVGTWLSILECGLNLLLLILGVILPQYHLLEAVAEDRAAASPVTAELLLNFAIAGTMGWVAFQRELGALRPPSSRRSSLG